MNPALSSPQEVAAALRVSVPTVISWAQKGIIPAEVRVQRTYRFDLAAVKAAVAQPVKDKP
jgi:excisionase family DNA binding protein